MFTISWQSGSGMDQLGKIFIWFGFRHWTVRQDFYLVWFYSREGRWGLHV